MKRYLVTGGGGFLGKVLTKMLVREGHKVRALELPSVNTSELVPLGVDVHSGDLRNREDVDNACRGMDAVFHVAALAAPWGSYKSFYDINVMGTANVIDACRKYNVPRMIYTSSPSAIFDGTDHRGLDEDHTPYPQNYTSFYGKTKALAEKLSLAANAPDFITCAIRQHTIWGPGDNHLFPRIFKNARSGRLSIIGTGENMIDVTHVEDAARAHILASKTNECAGKAYFISQGKPESLWGMVISILEKSGVKPPTRKVPYRTARAAASAIELIWKTGNFEGEPPLTRYMVDELARDHYYDISRARKDLGYEPRVTIEIGMDAFIEWIKTDLMKRI